MTYASPDQFFFETKSMARRGTALLVAAAVVVLVLAAAVLELPRVSAGGLSSYLLVLDYLAIPAIAGPGLTLYLLRVYSFYLARKGRPTTFSRKAKVGLVSASWVAVAAVLVASLFL